MGFGLRRSTSQRILLSLFLLLVVFFVLKLYINTSSVFSANTTMNAANLNTKGKVKEVDLVVVEEHHEVLEYWFKAANKGIIPKSGNILLHIDAHSDMAPPELVENFPFFRWPKNKVEIKAMMQSNDVFIQGAAMSGLFKKVIWVWPSWDEETHQSDDIRYFFAGGWTEITVEGEKEKTFCECELKQDGVTKDRCYYVNRTAFVDENYDGTEVDDNKCKILGKIEYQELVDYNALNLLVSGKLVKEGESLLLDMDEDFFGCVLRGQSLVDVGIEWSNVEQIDELLNEFVCPKVTQHEGLANNLMQNILSLVVGKCKSKKTVAKNCLNPGHPLHRAFTSSLSKILKSSDQEMFCEMGKRKKTLELLVEEFLRLKVHQLKAIADIGFCMQTSPRSYDPTGFQICHGANEPNSSAVTVHMPGENEVRLRLSRLQRIIEAKSYPTPGMVTLCRSVRDGYTPVPYFREIEKKIIKSVQTSRPGVRYNAVYDKNLLGGKKGWPSRQRKDPLVSPSNVRRKKVRTS